MHNWSAATNVWLCLCLSGMPAAYDLSTVIGGSGTTVSHNNLIPIGTDTHARMDIYTHAHKYTYMSEISSVVFLN